MIATCFSGLWYVRQIAVRLCLLTLMQLKVLTCPFHQVQRLTLHQRCNNVCCQPRFALLSKPDTRPDVLQEWCCWVQHSGQCRPEWTFSLYLLLETVQVQLQAQVLQPPLDGSKFSPQLAVGFSYPYWEMAIQQPLTHTILLTCPDRMDAYDCKKLADK